MFATRLARRGIGARHLFAIGFAISIGALGLIVTRAFAFTYVPWALYGLGSAVNVLGFTVLSEGFPRELTARANTALNLLMFGGSFVAQWGIGVVVDLGRAMLGGRHGGWAAPRVSRWCSRSTSLAYAWFAFGWRRHARNVAAIAPA